MWEKFQYSVIFIFALLYISFLSAQPYSITKEKLKTHVYILASDSLQGRFPGSNGGIKTQEYILGQFKEANLQLIGESGRNCFSLPPKMAVRPNSFFEAKGEKYLIGKDCVPFFTNFHDTINTSIIFVGYGIDLDSLHNNYKSVDISGKWALILRGKPMNNDIPQSFYTTQYKIQTATEHGAAGVLLVSPPYVDNDDRIDMTLFTESTYNQNLQSNIPVIRISRGLTDSLLKENRTNLSDLIDSCDKKPFDCVRKLNSTVHSFMEFGKDTIKACNIVAFKEGTDPILKNEIIVVGAHHDHLGCELQKMPNAPPQSPKFIFYGADDNASGTASVIELAKYIGLSGKNFKRSILFVTFDAEEEGLLGSKHFIDHLPNSIDKKQIKAMINLDMVGRLKASDSLQIMGCNSSTEGTKLMNQLAKKAKIPAQIIPFSWLFSSSDHASFYQKQIPVFFFFTGLHTNYHKRTDTADKIEYQGMEDVANLVTLLIEDLANRKKNLTFKGM